MGKKEKDQTIKKSKIKSYNVIGLLQVFVLVSIAYSTYVVVLGTDGLTPKVMVVPQTLYATVLLVNKFLK